MSSVTFPASLGGDGSTVTDDSNATTGLANGGHRTRFIPALSQTVNMAQSATNSAAASAASAASAVLSPGTNATSTTSLAISVGSKVFVIQTGKPLVAGMSVKIASTASPTNWMHGDIVGYTSSTGDLSVSVSSTQGSGTFAAWTISLSGPIFVNRKNLLINGDGMLNQRGLTTVADDTYCFDRWYALTQTAAVGVSQLTDVEPGVPFMMRLTQTQAAAQRMGIAQIVESKNASYLRGQSVTLSIKARLSNSQPLRYVVINWSNTPDGVVSDVILDWTSTGYTTGLGFFLGSGCIVSEVGVHTPLNNVVTACVPISLTVAAPASNLVVVIWTEGTAAQNFTMDLAVELVPGGTLGQCERRSYAEELTLARRYYESYKTSVNNERICLGQCTSATVARAQFVFAEEKRIVPTVTYSAANTFVLTNSTGSGSGAATAVISTGISSRVVEVEVTIPSGLTGGHATALLSNVAAVAEIAANAEL